MTKGKSTGDSKEPGADSAAKAEGAAEAPEAGASGAEAAAELAEARKQLVERTADLQRLQAEYQNYRKRVERDRVTVREIAVAALLENLLPVLDDIGRAREHEELTGGFKSVGESLETVVSKLGLQQFGKQGEPFDPQLHEALMHSYSSDVTETTCVQILQPGYKIGERIIRPARVAVAEPEPGAAESDTDTDTGGKSSAESGGKDAADAKGDGGGED